MFPAVIVDGESSNSILVILPDFVFARAIPVMPTVVVVVPCFQPGHSIRFETATMTKGSKQHKTIQSVLLSGWASFFGGGGGGN